MIQVNTLTDDVYQSQTINYNNGSIAFTLKYFPNQLSWFIEQLTYGSFIVQGLRVSTNLNVLRQFKNLIPFGLMCLTSDNNDPTQQQDFSSGYASLYVLDQADVAAVEAAINGI